MSVFEFRTHQSDAINEITGSVAFGSKKVIANLPTSFGKSAVLAGLAKELPGKVAIVVTFSPLIEQIAAHLDMMDMDYSILKAGMDDRYDEEKRVQLIMKQTLHARKDKVNLDVDYMLKDEVHVEWFGQKRMDEIFAALGFPVLVGVSGTPWDSKGYKLRGTDDMITTKSIAELQAEGYLSPVKYFIPKWAENVDYSDIAVKGGDYTEKDIDSIVLEDAYMDNAVDSMFAMGIDKKKTIVFCNSIEHANLVAGKLKAKGVGAYSFHSKDDKKRSEAILESFKYNKETDFEVKPAKPKTLTEEEVPAVIEKIKCTTIVAVNKISIGFDAPDIELGVMMRKTAVRSLFYQQVGRLIRIAPGKLFAELLDLANNTATFGFHDEPYNPPEYGDKEGLRKAEEKNAAREVALVINEEPTEVKREIVLQKVEELKAKAKKLPELQVADILAIYETSQDPEQIMHVAYEMNFRKTGQAYTQRSIEWVAGPWIAMLDKFPQYKSRILKTMRTMAKNKVAQGKKLNALYYSVEWLSEQTPYSISQVEYNEIDEDEIPY